MPKLVVGSLNLHVGNISSASIDYYFFIMLWFPMRQTPLLAYHCLLEIVRLHGDTTR